MKLRPYREGDIADLVSLVNEAERGSYEFIPRTQEEVQAQLAAASCILLATDEQERIAGFGYLRQDWYGETLTVSVIPGASQKEVADLLLAAMELESRTRSVGTTIDPQDQARLALFTARGYKMDSSLYQLVAQLDQPRPLPRVPPGYVIRSLRYDEEEALIRLANAAYQGERLGPGIIARWREEDPAFGPDWVQVAEYESQLVALVAARSDRAYNERYHARRGYLGPAGTLPAHRGNNLSKALTARAMNLLRDQGMQTACLHTWDQNSSALAVTRSLGFRLDHEWLILRKTLR